MNFKIYYGDGLVYSGEPENAPCEDVQCVVWNDPHKGVQHVGRIILREYDLYIYSDPIGWHGTDKYYDLIQHLQQGCGPGGVRAVLCGRWIPWNEYQAIMDRARTDIDFDPKSAIRVYEDGRT